jgi:hypothetical protein
MQPEPCRSHDDEGPVSFFLCALLGALLAIVLFVSWEIGELRWKHTAESESCRSSSCQAQEFTCKSGYSR